MGDILCAFVTDHGFTGIGKCTSDAVPILDFRIQGGRNLWDVDLSGETHILEENVNNIELCEYVIGVHWFDELNVGPDIQNAKSVAGRNLGITQHIQTVLTPDNPKTVFLENEFNVRFVF